MSRTLNRRQSLQTSTIDQILRAFPDLEYEPRMQFKQFLSSASILTSFIRQNIIEEGMIFRNGILVIQGALIISKKVGNGRLVFAELGVFQIANIQNFIYERAHYTATVNSSLIKYVQIPQNILKTLFDDLNKIIISKQRKRNSQIESKLKQLVKKQQSNQKQKMINRLSLPAIRLFQSQGKNSNYTSPFQSPKQKKHTSKEKQSSPKMKHKSKSVSKMMSQISTNLMGQDPFKKPVKTIIQTEPISQRNQRIFKQQLKSIIKRKIIFERKQLGVIKAYRPNNNQLIYQDEEYSAHPQQNRIDQYFKI